MEKITLTQKPLLTYDQWVIEHAKRSLKGKLRRARRRFTKSWNRMIDRIQVWLHKKSTRKNLAVSLFLVGTTVFLIGCTAVFYQAGEADTFALGIRTTYGTYESGTVTTLDGNNWEVENVDLPEKAVCVVTFTTNGTENKLDDEVRNIKVLFKGFK